MVRRGIRHPCRGAFISDGRTGGVTPGYFPAALRADLRMILRPFGLMRTIHRLQADLLTMHRPSGLTCVPSSAGLASVRSSGPPG